MVNTEIPTELRQEILDTIQRINAALYPTPKDRVFILRTYIKYGRVRLYPGETYESKLQEKLNCKTFTRQALYWLKRQSDQW